MISQAPCCESAVCTRGRQQVVVSPLPCGFLARRQCSRRVRRRADVTAAYDGNLGVLQGLAEPETMAAAEQWSAAASAVQFSGGAAIYVDPPAIAASLIVLLLLLALSGNRILGLELLFGKWLREMQEQREQERREEVISARQALQRQFEEGDGGDGGGSSSSGGGGGKL